MDKAEIAERLRSYFESEFPNPGEVELALTTDLLREWFIDSISIVTTVLFLEKEFGVQVQRGDINAENFQSIHTLAAFVARHLGERKS